MAHDHDHIDPAGLAHEVATRLAGVGQRLTGTRRAIVEALANAEKPLSIPEILSTGGGLAQSSVYRNLAVLERAGAVTRVVTTDEWARFELSEALTGHHHHLVCSRSTLAHRMSNPCQPGWQFWKGEAAFRRCCRR